MLSPSELETAKAAIDKLKSDKYKNQMYLFLAPFDVDQVPGYMSVVSKKLDLQTVEEWLLHGRQEKEEGEEQGDTNVVQYATLNDFWKDLEDIFENAIRYHSTQPNTKWIAKLAKEMLKVVQGMQQKQEQRKQKGGGGITASSGASDSASGSYGAAQQQQQAVLRATAAAPTKKIKIRVKKGIAPSSSADSPPLAADTTATASLETSAAAAHPLEDELLDQDQSQQQPPSSSTSTSSKPKVSLKLKLPTLANKKATAAATTTAASATTTSSNNPTTTTSAPPNTTIGTTKKSQAKQAIKAKPTQPKIKLKLSLNKAVVASANTNHNSTTATATIAGGGAGGTKKNNKKNKQPPKKAGAMTTSATTKNNKAKDTTTISEGTTAAAAAEKQQAPKKLTLKLSATGASAFASASPANTNTNSTAVQQGMVGSMGGSSRGKELPKGVVAATGNSTGTTTTTSKKRPSISSSSASPTLPAAGAGGAKSKKKKAKTAAAASANIAAGSSSNNAGGSTIHNNSNFPYAQACKVLNGLKRRQNKSIAWFLQPVSDKAILADYKAKIRHPMDLQTMTAKLERSGNTTTSSSSSSNKLHGFYTSTQAFVVDLRRIFANCLQYNTSIKDSLRPVAVELLETAEELARVFLASRGGGGGGGGGGGYTPLLYCWKLCVGVMDTLFNLINPEDGQPTALYFLHPVSFYCGGKFPPDYLEKISKPIDFGTITSNLLEGRYQVVDEFCSDCLLVLNNCTTYYNGRDDGKIYVEHANRLNEVLAQQIEQLTRYVKSPRGAADQARAAAPVVLPVPPMPTMLGVLDELRALKYTDKATKITEPAMGPFEKPVSLAVFPDYTQYVASPMDLQTVERKVKSQSYSTPEDFEYDVNLIFRNCEVYNSRRNGDHLVAMSRFGTRQFRRLFYAKMRLIEDPSSMSVSSVAQSTSPTVASASSMKVEASKASSSTTGAPKKLNIAESGGGGEGGASKSKSAPRISITAAQVSSAALNAARAKSPGAGQKKLQQGQQQLAFSQQQQQQQASSNKANQPVPLHIAIARVKEAFPIRRPHKQLQPWEADCARYFKELMRHPWISAARPKFIFHVPVPTLFPELREAYAAKIRKPMDLTTVECTLLQGNRYTQPDDFLQDIALVFANAVRFNKDGRDIGDPLSCAYYDASVHLLRYSRWLSLEILLQYSDSTSEHVDEGTPDGLPPFSWRLTEGNRKRAREEMEKIILIEPIDKSLEGDRYSWHEAECEKLLKALRHQSDLKHMTFFIQPNYPPDYTAFIAKPMDWEKVQRTLKKRQYDKFGDVIEDLRLVFSNALKYNARLKGTDTVSGRAYESAKYMSAKLEAAVIKLMLSVSDRLERERIDHGNAEREIEAAEQAEEAKIREAWKNPKEGEKEGASSLMPNRSGDAVQKIRLVRRAVQRPEKTDFEIPFFDEEDNGQHERSYFEFVKFQKALFEKQRQELSQMRQCSAAIGSLVYSRIAQHDLAVEWVRLETGTSPTSPTLLEASRPTDGRNSSKQDEGALERAMPAAASTVLGELERQGRDPLQIKLALPKAKNKGTKRKAPQAFDF